MSESSLPTCQPHRVARDITKRWVAMPLLRSCVDMLARIVQPKQLSNSLDAA